MGIKALKSFGFVFEDVILVIFKLSVDKWASIT